MFCIKCGNKFDDKFCPKCGTPAIRNDESCPKCGAQLENGKCNYCGYCSPNKQVVASQPPVMNQPPVVNQVMYTQYPQQRILFKSNKSKTVAIVLCLFLGIFGIHRFYVNKTGTGIIYLFTLGLYGIGWLVDLFAISTGSFKDKYGLPLR